MRRHALGWWLLGFVLLATAGSAGRAGADGDPLEMYDFSGKAAPAAYVQQSRARVWRHGLWTVQRHVLLDPFEGSRWALEGCRFERVNVFYGTRPMWCSETTYRAAVSAEPFGEAPRGRFRLVADTWGEDRGAPAALPVVDVTGGEGITLHLHLWNGSVSGGQTGQLVRLAGDTPATARVEALWSGAYERLVDLDADGRPEIVDTDFVHAYASYLPGKGIWVPVVLCWDPDARRYAVAGRKLFVAAWRDRRTTEADFVEAQRGSVRDALAVLRDAPPDRAEGPRSRVLYALASALSLLLWSGHVDEARALYAEVELETLHIDDEAVSKEAWWARFTEGCRGSNYFDRLCGLFPALRGL